MKTTLAIAALIFITAALIVAMIKFSEPNVSITKQPQAVNNDESSNNADAKKAETSDQDAEKKQDGVRNDLKNAVQNAIDEEIQRAVRDELSRNRNKQTTSE